MFNDTVIEVGFRKPGVEQDRPAVAIERSVQVAQRLKSGTLIAVGGRTGTIHRERPAKPLGGEARVSSS